MDTQTDELHCGGCDLACQAIPNALPVCTLGQCGLACNPGFLNCDGQLATGCEVNSSFDLEHCGACGNPCKPGESCKSGICVLSCGGGTTECNGKCVDLATDETNCGDCGKACALGQSCNAGECQLNCGPGTMACNEVCVDTKIDPNNCGGCGQVCGAGYKCSASTCVSGCGNPVTSDVFFDEFADNSKSWLLGNNWAIKAATASSGDQYGNPDPSFDATSTANNGVAGVVVGGNVPVTVHQYIFLTSPAVDTASVATLFLSFSRWLNSDYEPYMKNVVQVFNGTTWVTIWETLGSPGIQDNGWVKQSFDITAHKNTSLRVRFGYSIGLSTAFVVSGWNIDDVKLTAVTCN